MKRQKQSFKRVLFFALLPLFLFFFTVADQSWSDGPWSYEIAEAFLNDIALSLNQANPTEQQCRNIDDRLSDALKNNKLSDEYHRAWAHFFLGAAQSWLFMLNTDPVKNKEYYFTRALQNLAEAERILPDYATTYYIEGLLFYRNNNNLEAERKVLKTLELDPQYPGAKELLQNIQNRSNQSKSSSAGNSSQADNPPSEFKPIPFD